MPALDPARWAALTPYLDEVLQLPDDQHAQWLTELRDREPDIAGEIEVLLARHQRLNAAGFLDGNALPPEERNALKGMAIGPYTLRSPIGHGGMGSVWLAERTDGRFDRRAAIKFLNLAMSAQGEARFRREGRILARLADSHIAQLLDAGVTSSGQPYLVLEFVDGEPIDVYCRERHLDVPARVGLFLEVLAAVAHAHAQLIVHRDIKPSNVLVTRDGHAKLLDFGIAALLDDDGSSAGVTRLTRDGDVAMTPEYAAPEQVLGQSVSTATDVYALGVLFYRLLTGEHPAGTKAASTATLIKAIVEDTPARPSDRVSDVRLRRTLRGDLDTIVGKALKKDPAERYGSVTVFADDLRRYLRHEPITARPDSIAYRAAKFVRRHRWPVAAAVAAFVLLAAGLVAVNRQRQIAESRFTQLRHLSEQVFGFDAQINTLPGATAARHALVAASLEYLEGLRKDVRGDVDLLREVSDGYWRVARIQGVPTGLNLGDFAAAEKNLATSAALGDEVLTMRPLDARALERTATVAHDRMIIAESERRDGDALAHAQRALERTDRLLASGTLTAAQRTSVLGILANVAAASVNLGRYDDAVQVATRLLGLASTSGDAQPLAGYAHSVIANARRLQGDLPAALQAIREARTVSDRIAFPNETKRMFDRYPLLLREAFILGEDRGISLDRPDEAAALLREAMEMHEAGARRDANDVTSRTRVATSARELGDILRWRDPAAALTVYDLARLRLSEIRNNVKARRDTALVLANSSYALRRLDRVRDARRRVDEALHLLEETHDAPADRIALDSELCAVLKARADQEAAEGHVATALAQYDVLLTKIAAGAPAVDENLAAANALAFVYEDLVRLHPAQSDAARAVEARRLALWERWQQRLPGNDFVARRLRASGAGPS